QQIAVVAHPERRQPPRDIVIPGNDDHPADIRRVFEERASTLELARARALAQVARNSNDVDLLFDNQAFNRFVLLRHSWMAEVQIGTVNEPDIRHSVAMIASVN